MAINPLDAKAPICLFECSPALLLIRDQVFLNYDCLDLL